MKSDGQIMWRVFTKTKAKRNTENRMQIWDELVRFLGYLNVNKLTKFLLDVRRTAIENEIWRHTLEGVVRYRGWTNNGRIFVGPQ